MRVKVTLRCSECKQRNYNTMKNKKNDPDRLEMKKYCRFCKKHTVHNETKYHGQADRANIMAEVKKENWFDRTWASAQDAGSASCSSELKKVVWPTTQPGAQEHRHRRLACVVVSRRVHLALRLLLRSVVVDGLIALVHEGTKSWRKTAKWYVVHTYSGYENTVKATIEKTVETRSSARI